MELNLPVLDQLTSCRNLLIAGMGGGFDVFCGLPIFFELRRRGQTVHLANFSFSNIQNFHGGIRLSESLVGVTADTSGQSLYFPELYLARWFQDARQESVPIWCFHKTGARPLLRNYQLLIEHLAVDGVLLVDGGVDSLVRGDEAETGSLIEDATSLFAVSELKDLKARLLVCLGLGAEGHLACGQVLENIAGLSSAGGFLGACALTAQMAVYRAYEAAVLAVQAREFQDPSVINSSIISAVQGHFGDYHLTEKTRGSSLSISPLMSLYWFFDLAAVCARNLFLGRLGETETFIDALRVYAGFAGKTPRRRPTSIGLGI